MRSRGRQHPIYNTRDSGSAKGTRITHPSHIGESNASNGIWLVLEALCKTERMVGIVPSVSDENICSRSLAVQRAGATPPDPDEHCAKHGKMARTRLQKVRPCSPCQFPPYSYSCHSQPCFGGKRERKLRCCPWQPSPDHAIRPSLQRSVPWDAATIVASQSTITLSTVQASLPSNSAAC